MVFPLLRQELHGCGNLSGGDIDAAWENTGVGRVYTSGIPTPDQNDVEAMGLIFEDGERLHSTEKVKARDEHG